MHASVMQYFIQNVPVMTQCLTSFDLLGHIQHHGAPNLRVYIGKEVFSCESMLFIFKAAVCYGRHTVKPLG